MKLKFSSIKSYATLISYVWEHGKSQHASVCLITMYVVQSKHLLTTKKVLLEVGSRESVTIISADEGLSLHFLIACS